MDELIEELLRANHILITEKQKLEDKNEKLKEANKLLEEMVERQREEFIKEKEDLLKQINALKKPTITNSSRNQPLTTRGSTIDSTVRRRTDPNVQQQYRQYIQTHKSQSNITNPSSASSSSSSLRSIKRPVNSFSNTQSLYSSEPKLKSKSIDEELALHLQFLEIDSNSVPNFQYPIAYQEPRNDILEEESYEELSEYCANNNVIVSLPSRYLRQIPCFRFNGKKILDDTEDIKCSTCQEDFQHDDVLHRYPCCGHSFHKQCSEEWLRTHKTCTICKTDLEEYFK